MKSLRNLGGTLFYKNTPIIEFKYLRGTLKTINMLTSDLSILPVEFRSRETKAIALTDFLMEQTIPDTRIGIHEYLTTTPMKHYDLERMLRWYHGYLFGSPFWIKQDDDMTCWESTSIEGIGVKPIECYEDIPYNWELIVTGKEYKRTEN